MKTVLNPKTQVNAIDIYYRIRNEVEEKNKMEEKLKTWIAQHINLENEKWYFLGFLILIFTVSVTALCLIQTK